MPAATLWRGDCDELPQRYFFDERDPSNPYPGDFGLSDIAYRLKGDLPKYKNLPGAVDAVTLRPGYKITLYSENSYKGES